ncbi:MAG TPA: hypothetical protein VJN93_01150 [Candidatus Acidoferrum sp.]|nr:hypothetical protein [Candidatus Acidoferrum sp.]
MTKTARAVRGASVEMIPMPAKERKRLDAATKRTDEKLRGRYREVHGKVVDWITHTVENGSLYVGIRFKDKTDFALCFSPKIVPDIVDLSEVTAGDTRLIREYFKRQDL